MGFGPLAALDAAQAVDPKNMALPEAAVRAIASAGWGRVCPGTRAPAALKAGAKLTPANSVMLLRTIVSRHYGLRVESTNDRNPARGVYRILPGEWPALRGATTFAEQLARVRALNAPPPIQPPANEEARAPPPNYDEELGDFV
jgi:hypothetical protein